MFIDAFERAVIHDGAKLAYVCGKKRTTYQELNNSAQSITTGLLNRGLMPGARVALKLQSISDFAASCIAVWRAGGIVVPLDSSLGGEELSFLFKIAQPSFVVCEKIEVTFPIGCRALEIKQLKDHQPNNKNIYRQEDEDLLIHFSSGTTGVPKGIVHSYASMSEVIRRSVSVSGLNSKDVLLASSLFSTGFGLHSYILEPLFCGATVVMVHPFHPRIALEIANQENVSWIQTVPAVLKLLLTVERAPKLSALRTIRLGAATLDEASRAQCVAKLNVQPTQGYGMGEVGRIACSTKNQQGTLGYMTVNTGIELKIFDDEKVAVEKMQLGEIGVRAASMCRPYYLVQNATKEPISMHNGYFMTGDLGKLSKEGLLKLVGRSKTFILTPRFKVDPREVEEVLMQHPAIREVTVLPAPGKGGYEVVKAVIVKEGVLTAVEVMRYCSDHLSQGKCPQIIMFMEQLPRNKLGKVEVIKLSQNL